MSRQRLVHFDNSDEDDDFSSTAAVRGDTFEEEEHCISHLSARQRKFAKLQLKDYQGCRDFVVRYSDKGSMNSADFLRAASNALSIDIPNKSLAKRCIRCAVIGREVRIKSSGDVNNYFSELISGRGDTEEGLLHECKEVFDYLSSRVSGQPLGRAPALIRLSPGALNSETMSIPSRSTLVPQVPTASGLNTSPIAFPLDETQRPRRASISDGNSSRLSPLGHEFIRIDTGHATESREFIEDHPEILDEDHQLYIREALSFLRAGHVFAAESAVEKSIILRNYNRRNPRIAFSDLSKNVRSAMDLLKERAEQESGSRNSATMPMPLVPIGVDARNYQYDDPRLNGTRRKRSPDNYQSKPAATRPQGRQRLETQQTAYDENTGLGSLRLQLETDLATTRRDLAITKRELLFAREGESRLKKELETEKETTLSLQAEYVSQKVRLLEMQQKIQSIQDSSLSQMRKDKMMSQVGDKILEEKRNELDTERKRQAIKEDHLREQQRLLEIAQEEFHEQKKCVYQEKLDLESLREKLRSESRETSITDDKATQTMNPETADNFSHFETPGIQQAAVEETESQAETSSSMLTTPLSEFSSTTATEYLLESYKPKPAATEDDISTDNDEIVDGPLGLSRVEAEVIQGLNFRFKEVQKREDDVEARELQVQLDQDQVKLDREKQRHRDIAAMGRKCHGCGIAVLVEIHAHVG